MKKSKLRRATRKKHSEMVHSSRVQVDPTVSSPQLDACDYIAGPKLRAKLGISAVTLWRWRRGHGFPAPKLIRGRLYFRFGAVAAWLARQPDAA
jgi:hypothetical protein